MTEVHPRASPEAIVRKQPRVLGLVEGDPRSALSGVAGFLFDALVRRGFRLDTIDYSPVRSERLALAGRTLRISRAEWRARFHTSRAAYDTLTRTLVRRLDVVRPGFDVAVQVHGWVGGQPKPYTLFVDQTRLMAERGWPGWLPFTRTERSDLLARERAMYHESEHIFTMGVPARESVIEDYGVDPDRVTVVGGGGTFAPFPSAGRLVHKPSILFVGREFERKGGACLLRAFERVRTEIPDAELHIVGATPGSGDAGVTEHGKISDRARLSGLYRSARVFCLPSIYEPYGLVLIEAMAHGVPCVGSAVGAIPEILDHGQAGRLVPPDDPDRLAEALLSLLADDDLAASLGARGRARAQTSLTWDAVVERMMPALRRAAAPCP